MNGCRVSVPLFEQPSQDVLSDVQIIVTALISFYRHREVTIRKVYISYFTCFFYIFLVGQ